GPRALHSFPTRCSSDLEGGAHAHGLLALELVLDAVEHHLRGLLPGQLGDLVELSRQLRLASLEQLSLRLQVVGPLVEPLLDLVRSEEHTSELQSRENLV